MDSSSFLRLQFNKNISVHDFHFDLKYEQKFIIFYFVKVLYLILFVESRVI